MLLDSGILEICSLKNRAASANMPAEYLVPISEHLYGERAVGYGRQYAAKGVNEQIDLIARVWQDRAIRIGMYAVVDGIEQFRIDNVQHLFDEDGIRVTDLTLQRLDDLYDISREG